MNPLENEIHYPLGDMLPTESPLIYSNASADGALH